jgi:hypothetical protein
MNPHSGRRALLAAALCAAVSAVTSDAWAGSYLDRASMLIEGSVRDARMLRARLTDKELARVVQIVAEARSRAASKMDVPAVVAKAHPHLLLTLSRVERAATAAMGGDLKVAFEHLEGARREETIFRAMLKEAGHPLPAPAARS